MKQQETNIEMYQQGYWNAITFAYIPDFANDEEKEAYKKGYRDGMKKNNKSMGV
jgi:hypothetical protein